MGCLSLPWACWLFVGVLRSELTTPLLLQTVGSLNALSPLGRLSDVPTFSFSLHRLNDSSQSRYGCLDASLVAHLSALTL